MPKKDGDQSLYAFEERRNTQCVLITGKIAVHRLVTGASMCGEQVFNTFSKLSIKDIEQPKEIAAGYTYDISLYNGKEVLSIVYGKGSDKLIIN